MFSGKEISKEFRRRARKRARQLRDGFREIIATRDAEAVHDVRKTTRHLQTIVDACGVNAQRSRALKLRRRLQGLRHALGDWRDTEVMIGELKKVQHEPGLREARRNWQTLEQAMEKKHRLAAKKFLKRRKSFDLKRVASRIVQTAKRESRSKRVMQDVRALLEESWSKWLSSIDEFVDNKSASALHRVRIKAKGLNYALDLMLHLYPDDELQRYSNWLKEIQDNVGAWHDELALGHEALKVFSDLPRDSETVKFIRHIKEKEIRLGEAAREFITSIQSDADYQNLRRHLSAAVFAMSNSNRQAQPTSEQLSGASA